MVRMGVDRRLDPGQRGVLAERTASLVDVRLELGAELTQVARDGVDREVAERAERAAEHPVADVLEQVEVGLRRIALLDPRQQLHEPARSLAARRALATGLVHVELLRAQRE